MRAQTWVAAAPVQLWGWHVIRLTRLNGETLALNPDLIERVEVTPDTVITLTDGTKYVVAESLDDIVDEMVELRARSFARAQEILATEADASGEEHEPREPTRPPLRGRVVRQLRALRGSEEAEADEATEQAEADDDPSVENPGRVARVPGEIPDTGINGERGGLSGGTKED